MNREELEKIMPHREGMLLIDEAECRDGIAYAKKLIRKDEWFLQGHFPGNPVVPGVILCEIMAQSTCVLLATDSDCPQHVLLTGIQNVRFRKPVRPGDLIRIQSKILKSKSGFYWAKGTGLVGSDVCVEGEFSFLATGT